MKKNVIAFSHFVWCFGNQQRDEQQYEHDADEIDPPNLVLRIGPIHELFEVGIHIGPAGA